MLGGRIFAGMFRNRYGWSTAVVLGALLSLAAAARAQRGDIRYGGARTVVGVVRDSAGAVIDSADVYIGDLKIRALSDSAGRFSFNAVKPGAHSVAVRRIGFYPQKRDVFVGDSGGVVLFELVPLSRRLPTIVATATRGGISGVVGDTSFRVIPGVNVRMLAGSHHATTDSIGRFFIDAPPGKYMLRVSGEGYAPRLVSVTVPKDSGRQIQVFLSPADQGGAVREEVAIFDLGQRLARRSAAYSAIFTREDIAKLKGRDLASIAASGANTRVDDTRCEATIAGVGVSLPIWAVDPDEVEVMEVYASRPTRSTVTSINLNGVRTQTPSGGAGVQRCPQVIVWPRK
jgi:hypothetical protein